MNQLSISHTTRQYPNLPYAKISRAILGPTYTLSLVFVGEQRARTLNQTTRGKQYVPDVLSFPLYQSAGEIYLCLPRIRQTASQYGHSIQYHTGYLFIHGILHLKGYQHGATMEQAERRLCRRFLGA